VHTHEPVSEDCTLCHNPHGTTTENMLKVRPPVPVPPVPHPHGPQIPQLLGQQTAGTANTLATTGKNAINYTMARGCLNWPHAGPRQQQPDRDQTNSAINLR